MEEKKIIAICQSGGAFEMATDGSLSYKGGDAHAIDIDDQMKFVEFEREVAEMFSCSIGAMSVKYFLPGNVKTLITISNDKDLKRMIKFHGDSVTAYIYIMTEEILPSDISNLPCSRSGGSDKRPKRHDDNHDSLDNIDTVYRILCPTGKIGGVIGKGGGIVKALREDTQAKITVAESVPGSDERVIIIYSSPKKIPKTKQGSSNEDEEEAMEPHCAAQDALMKVHDRIIEDDLYAGKSDNTDDPITVRLLVSNTMVGCILGKGGDVIRKLRTETGASIRVLPEDSLPTCAMDTDELVQITGTPKLVRGALFKVSTLLHQNPRKDKNPPLSLHMPFRGHGFPPPREPMWSHHNPGPRGMPPPLPWRGGFRDEPSGFMPGGFNNAPPGQGGEAGDFSMKILCSAAKIGGVIGKAGFNVRQLEHMTGAIIHVEEAASESDERVIRVSAFEELWNPRSQTIDAILELQNTTGEYEKGKITTRLLVPSSKVGCLLGQGGKVINEMRRRTQADIRIYSKNEKPSCASEDEELVQISAIYEIAKDALGEIGSRLRSRTLRDADAGEKPPVRPAHGYGPGGDIPRRGPPSFGAIGGGGSSGRYEPFEDVRRGYESDGYPLPPIASRYPNVNIPMEPKFPNNGTGSFIGPGRSDMPGIGEITGTRPNIQDPRAGGPDRAVDIHGPSQHLNAPPGTTQNYMPPARHDIIYSQSPYRSNVQQGSYQSTNVQPESYQGLNNQQGAYQGMNENKGSYQPLNPEQGPYQGLASQEDPYRGSYQPMTSQQDHYQAPYQGGNPQPGPYQAPYHGLNTPQSGPLQTANPPQSTYDPYQSANAQQGLYQSTNAPHVPYPSGYDQQGSYQSSYGPPGTYQSTNTQAGMINKSAEVQEGSYPSSIVPQPQ